MRGQASTSAGEVPVVILVHGGAKEISEEKAAAFKAGCQRAASVGWAILQEGGMALDAVEAAVRILEDDPTFNAGCGAVLNPDGVVRLDAGIMDGETLDVGAVALVEEVPNPVSLARRVLARPEVLIAGPHARAFAEEVGVPLSSKKELITEEQLEEWRKARTANLFLPHNDTVGAVALDSNGNLAAAVSTGGTGDKRPGRIGDSPSVGSGFYADNELGAAAALTGVGEAIMRVALARTAVGDTEGGTVDPEVAARQSIAMLERRTGQEAGILMVDRQGRIGWSHNAANMAVGYRTAGMDAPVAYVHKDEEARSRG